MALLVAHDIGKSWADRVVLESCDLVIEPGDRIGIVGHNGCGKSTLMQVLAGLEAADHGTLQRSGSVALLQQAPVFSGRTVQDVVDGAMAWHHALLTRYEQRITTGEDASSEQAELDLKGWTLDHKAADLLERLQAPPRDRLLHTLSGGEQRRLALVVTLLAEADLLLLDEPTNHLDADTVEWLQAYLIGRRGALLLITHDRYLLEAVTDRIVEVEQGKTWGYVGSYTDYLIARAERQVKRSELRSRQLRRIAHEAAWAARSPSARTGKQRARLQRLDALRENVPTLNETDFELGFRSGVARGVVLLEGHDLSVSLGGKRLIHELDLVIRPGERWGVLGPNGVGKTTLLRLLQGTLTPDQGEIIRGPRSRIGVLDQTRTGLTDTDTVLEAAGGGALEVQLGDHWVTVQSFLQRFAFDRTHFDQRVGALSGGERARLLMARLMLQGATLLLLDEPTNDLDLLTLRVLEEGLLRFDGGAVVVTHDRAFLDRVCTDVLVFEGDGVVVHYASRQQHLAARAARIQQARATRAKQAQTVQPTTAKPPRSKASTKPGLSYRERQEFDALPNEIEALELSHDTLEAKLGDPATYRDGTDVSALSQALQAAADKVDAAYARWEALSSRAKP